MGMEAKRRLLLGDNKNNNYFFVCNAKMYLIRTDSNRCLVKKFWFGGFGECCQQDEDMIP